MWLAHIAMALVAAFPAAAPPSTDPYTASLRYAQCMRAHGVPHPNPDRRGDFRLTPAQERWMRAVPRSARKAADDACFRNLKGLDLRPLTPERSSDSRTPGRRPRAPGSGRRSTRAR